MSLSMLMIIWLCHVDCSFGSFKNMLDLIFNKVINRDNFREDFAEDGSLDAFINESMLQQSLALNLSCFESCFKRFLKVFDIGLLLAVIDWSVILFHVL
jgi:hypothetical protein